MHSCGWITDGICGISRRWRTVSERPNSIGPRSWRWAITSGLALACAAGTFGTPRDQGSASSSNPAQAATAKSVGTVKSVAGKTITLAPESGGEMTVTVQDGARVVRVELGSADLKNAAPLALEDLQPGDRILVRGVPGEGGKSLLAVSVIAMKKADLADKHARERDEWQKQ